MEKAPGVQLFKVWDTITESSKLSLIKLLTKLENQLSSIKFPAYGSLYLAQSQVVEGKQIPLASEIDSSNSYFVGTSCDRS